jgi:dihydroorotase
MLVDNQNTLDALFSSTPMLIATHCEDERTILDNMQRYQAMGSDHLDASFHPKIRSVRACALSSSLAISLAEKHGTRLHILHISTAPETDFFRNDIPIAQKRITSEVCVHHLSFNSEDYTRLGNLIKCNPAIKAKSHQEALWKALLDNRLDIIATDHAPHTMEEKNNPYLQAPSGLPLVQHALPMMLQYYHRGVISLERIVEKMCHAPAEVFRIKNRGYIREGYAADLALVDIHSKWTVNKETILYKCGWSPLEGNTFKGRVLATFVSGHLAYHQGEFDGSKMGERLLFLA